MKIASSRETYADGLLRLVFAEDQAGLYVEGFSVLSSSPAVRAQMNRLQDETNMHLISILELFKSADPSTSQPPESMEIEVAHTIAELLNEGKRSGATDSFLVHASIRLQDHLLAQYSRVIDCALSLGLSYDRRCLEAIYFAKQLRREAMSELCGDQPQIRPRNCTSTHLEPERRFATN